MKRLAVLAALLLACRAPQQHGVTIARNGKASARVLVTTVGVAIKETGPAETVKQFGEVYAFSPATFAVRATNRRRSPSGTSNPTTSTTSCSPTRRTTSCLQDLF